MCDTKRFRIIAKRPVYKYNGSFYILNQEEHLVSCFTGIILDEAKAKYVLSKALQYGYDALDYSNEDMYLNCDAISSAGNLKQNKIILYCVNHPTFDIKLFNEKCLYGMYKHLKRDVGFNMADNKKKWSQASTRLAQIKAFMAECAVSNCYAILNLNRNNRAVEILPYLFLYLCILYSNIIYINIKIN